MRIDCMRNHPPRGRLIASAMLSSPREKSLVWWKQDANDGLAEGVIMYMHVFSCRVFTRELSYFIAKSKNVVDVTFLPQGLHEAPKVLNSELQASIARFREECDSWRRRRRPDYLALCFGLCSDSIVGIEAIDVPIVVPRVDDCVGIYLGSEERYLEYFNKYKGTFWAFPSWAESSPSTDADYLDIMRAEYLKRYDGDEDLVEDMMELELDMTANYSNVGYITSPLAVDPEGSREHAARYARDHNWNLIEVEGDLSLMEQLLNGPWDEDKFLVVPPGYRIAAAPGIEKVRAVKA